MFRRIYQYSVALISLETIVWGTINSARQVLALINGRGNLTSLANWLALALVSLPIFIIHWRLMQGDLRKYTSERASLTRALFLYAILLANLVGAMVFGLAWLTQLFLASLGLSSDLAIIAGLESAVENLAATIINLLAAGVFYGVVKGDQQVLTSSEEYTPRAVQEILRVRRIFRYGWWLASLSLMVLGAYSLLHVGLEAWQPLTESIKALLANGMAFLLVNLPVFMITTIMIRRSMPEGQEKESLLLLAALYTLAFAGVVGTLFAIHQILNRLLRAGLAGEFSPAPILTSLSTWVALAIPLGITWLYYGRQLRQEIQRRTEVPPRQDTRRGVLTTGLNLANRIRQESLQRLYDYILAGLGLGAAAIGLRSFFGYLVNLGLGMAWLSDSMRITLSYAISLLAVGLPMWIVRWRAIQHRTIQEGELGEHARRSFIRQGYLYLILTVSIVGGMFTSGTTLFNIINALLGKATPDFLSQMLFALTTALVFWLAFGYHLFILRADQRMTGKALARRYAQFPVLILAPETDENNPAGDFVEQIVHALQQRAPGMPVAVHLYSQGAPDETLSLAQAVILPTELLVTTIGPKPAEAIRLWLQTYQGIRLVVSGLYRAPVPGQDWRWVTTRNPSMGALARRVAQMACQLAEE